MRTNKKNFVIILCAFFLTFNLFAQEQILVDEGLATVVNPPGRRSLTQTDLIENQLVKGCSVLK